MAISRQMIPYGRQTVEDADLQAVLEVLQSDWLTQGPAVERFENALAEYCGARHAIAVANGTAALHLACLAGGVGPGDEVIAPAVTFAASANAAVYCGARPVLADVDPATVLMTAETLSAAARNTTRLRAVVPVHLAGLPCGMEAILGIARAHGATVIEDACHAMGAIWTDANGALHRVGDCSHSDMACFSFHPVKHITTGEGGAIVTNSDELAARLRLLRTHGITKDPARLSRAAEGPWYYEMQELGFNYRISDLQCALGYAQMQRLPRWVERRRRIAARYRAAFAGQRGIALQAEPAAFSSSYHLFVIQVEKRREFFLRLRDRGIAPQVHYIPLNLQPFYQQTYGYRAGDCPNAEAYYAGAISLPMYPALTDAEVDHVIESVLAIEAELRPAHAAAGNR